MKTLWTEAQFTKLKHFDVFATVLLPSYFSIYGIVENICWIIKFPLYIFPCLQTTSTGEHIRKNEKRKQGVIIDKKFGRFCDLFCNGNLKQERDVVFVLKWNDGVERFCELFWKWYFVTKIVLTYCEKKIVLVVKKNFWNLGLKAENLKFFWNL